MKPAVLLASVLVPALAAASPLQSGRVAVSDSGQLEAGTRAQSRTIYLNKAGITLMPGTNDSWANKSSLVTKQTVVPAWNANPQLWSNTVSCLREIFAPFDLAITETDPGPTVPHIEAVFGGSAATLGLPGTMSGVSPFSTSCGIIEHSIVFTFTNSIPQDAKVACEVMAQEIAHSYGLDHELLASDPMTYLAYSGKRSFQNTMAECGETSARACGISGSVCRDKQNSYALLMERIGAAGTGDIDPPTVAITFPRDGASVYPGFLVSASITDDVKVVSARATIDGIEVTPSTTPTSMAMPWSFATPSTLEPGEHVLEVYASDGKNEQVKMITVKIPSGTNDPSLLEDDSAGGCSAGGGSGWLFGLFLVGLVAIQRRAQR